MGRVEKRCARLDWIGVLSFGQIKRRCFRVRKKMQSSRAQARTVCGTRIVAAQRVFRGSLTRACVLCGATALRLRQDNFLFEPVARWAVGWGWMRGGGWLSFVKDKNFKTRSLSIFKWVFILWVFLVRKSCAHR